MCVSAGVSVESTDATDTLLPFTGIYTSLAHISSLKAATVLTTGVCTVASLTIHCVVPLGLTSTLHCRDRLPSLGKPDEPKTDQLNQINHLIQNILSVWMICFNDQASLPSNFSVGVLIFYPVSSRYRCDQEPIERPPTPLWWALTTFFTLFDMFGVSDPTRLSTALVFWCPQVSLGHDLAVLLPPRCTYWARPVLLSPQPHPPHKTND